MVEDQKGRLLLSGSGGGWIYDGKTFRSLADTTLGVGAVYKDQSGSIWLGTHKGIEVGLMRYDGEKTVSVLREGKMTSGVGITDILKDRDGVLWFTMFGGGVGRYDGWFPW